MDETVGQALRRQLEEAGVAQVSLARKTGLTTKHVNQLVQGNARLSVEVALLIEMAVPSISAEALLITQVRQEIKDEANKMNGGINVRSGQTAEAQTGG